ncbi:MAG: transcriptional repressor NrdR [Myxococcales bacterium]|nr:transcriptional repressor NrdR [Myxococcales bacterium]MCB9645526.1 transcriptional repressor NrdR [Deltaproteobacteria bacterium]
MKCPFCGNMENKVIDSRLSKDGQVIRRRRECNDCGKRFTTYERIEEVLPMVVKADGRREPFDHNKVVAGVRAACEKRPVPLSEIEELVDDIEKQLQETGEKEVEAATIGEEVLVRLSEIDDVAYIRYASIFRNFKDLEEFTRELNSLVEERARRAELGTPP